jgi:hypothetical protein
MSDKESEIRWHKWFEEDPWLRVGDKYESSSAHGHLDGKYLFFCEEIEPLKRLLEYEIKNHGFCVGKVIEYPRGKDYVACLYWTGDDRKYELAERYRDSINIKYRYYKKNSDTLAGKYSEQFNRDRSK